MVGGSLNNEISEISSEVFEPNPQTDCKVDPLIIEHAAGDFSKEAEYAIICGGSDQNKKVQKDCWNLNNNGTWRKINPLHEARARYTMSNVNGLMYSIGGYNDKEKYGLQSVEMFNKSTWSIKRSLDVTIHSHCTIRFDERTLACIGGIQNGKVKNILNQI